MGVWEFLTQDVTLTGGFHSPMLSWLGAAALLALCGWHSVFLVQSVLSIRRSFGRILAALAPLERARRQTNAEWIVLPALAKKPAQAGERRDLDDLQEIDRIMRAERTMAAEWISYRKTFSVEHPAWFLEPTVHAGRPAAEFFSFDSVCADHLNVRFYQQLPAFLTGIGLMFTFLAILLGLSKLHMNGSQIDGIQGLINGLAGKFVTSIVGLACANAFTLLEKSLWYRLARQYRLVVTALDQMFPQKAQHQNNPSSLAPSDRTMGLSGTVRNDSAHQLVEAVQQRLGATVAALTTVSESLAAIRTKGAPKPEELAADIGHEVQRALRPLLDPLLAAIRDLSHSVEKQRAPVQLSHAEMDGMFDRLREHLSLESPVPSGRAGQAEDPRATWKLPRFRLTASERADTP